MKPGQKQADLIYDIGLHRGEDSDYYLRKGFRVVGFEADPELAAHCRARFAGEIAAGRLTIIEGAIVETMPGESPGQPVRFFRNKNIAVWGSAQEVFARSKEKLGTELEVIEVQAVDFAACLQEQGIPHYLKSDIEGLDRVCLKALLDFEERPDYLSLESEKTSFPALLEEFELLTRLGYQDFKLVQQAGISRQREPNPGREGPWLDYRFQEGSSGLFGADLPGDWLDRDRAVEQYRKIFQLYRLFGEHSLISRYFPGKVLRKALSLLLGRPLPGWYDTHARHISAR